MTPNQLREIIADICKEEVEKQAHFLLDRFDGVLRLMMKQYPESQRGLAQAQVIMGNYRMVFGGDLSPDVVQRIGAHVRNETPEEEVAQPKVRSFKLSEEALAKRREKMLAKVIKPEPEPKPIRIPKIDLAVKAYKEGETDIGALAKKFEISKIYLGSYLKRTGVIPRQKPGRKPNAAVMERNENILALHRSGLKPASIAQIYGVSPKLVSQVVFQAARNGSGAPPAAVNGVGGPQVA